MYVAANYLTSAEKKLLHKNMKESIVAYELRRSCFTKVRSYRLTDTGSLILCTEVSSDWLTKIQFSALVWTRRDKQILMFLLVKYIDGE